MIFEYNIFSSSAELLPFFLLVAALLLCLDTQLAFRSKISFPREKNPIRFIAFSFAVFICGFLSNCLVTESPCDVANSSIFVISLLSPS